MNLDDELNRLSDTLDREITEPSGLKRRLLESAAAGERAADSVPHTVAADSARPASQGTARTRRTRRNPWLARVLVGAAAVAVAAVAFTQLGGGPQQVMANKVTQLGSECPAETALLPTDPSDADALRAAMDKIVAGHYTDADYSPYQVTSVKDYADAPVYGQMAAHFCGDAVAQSTWIIQLHFPKLEPSASMSAGQLFATKTTGGWDVWFRYH